MKADPTYVFGRVLADLSIYTMWSVFLHKTIYMSGMY